MGDEQETTQTHRGAWLWLFDKAAWRERVDRFGRFTVRLRRGEIAVSYRFLARAWNWSHGRVQRWLKLLADRGKLALREEGGVLVIALGGYREPLSESQKPKQRAVDNPVDDQQPSQSRESTKETESKGDGDLVRFAPKRVVPSPTATPEGRKQRRLQQVFEWIGRRLTGAAATQAMMGLMADDPRDAQRWLDRLSDEMKAEAARA